MQTTKYGIIWSENVHFVKNLTVMGTGGLYPRVRDFFLRRTYVYISQHIGMYIKLIPKPI